MRFFLMVTGALGLVDGYVVGADCLGKLLVVGSERNDDITVFLGSLRISRSVL